MRALWRWLGRGPWVAMALALVLGGAQCPLGQEDAGPGGEARRLGDAGPVGETGGRCVTPCQAAADCCSGPLCGQSVFNYRCDQGRCVQIGCRLDSDCADLPGGRCAGVNDFGICGLGCRAPEDCCAEVPPGVAFPDGGNTVVAEGPAGQPVTYYRCGVYPQKFLCVGQDVEPDDAGTIGVCLRICTADGDCPGITMPSSSGGTSPSLRVDAGFMAVPLGDGGVWRVFQQKCAALMGPVGQCKPGCLTDDDCCPSYLGQACRVLGTRQVCVSGACQTDGCRTHDECSAATSTAWCEAP